MNSQEMDVSWGLLHGRDHTELKELCTIPCPLQNAGLAYMQKISRMKLEEFLSLTTICLTGKPTLNCQHSVEI